MWRMPRPFFTEPYPGPTSGFISSRARKAIAPNGQQSQDRQLGVWTSKPMIIAAAALLVITLAGAQCFFSHGPMGTPSRGEEYSAYLTNSSNITSLDMDIKTLSQVSSDLEMCLPTNSDKSISARAYGAISHTSSTHDPDELQRRRLHQVLYLNGNWTSVDSAIDLDLSVLHGGMTREWSIHGQNYNVTQGR